MAKATEFDRSLSRYQKELMQQYADDVEGRGARRNETGSPLASSSSSSSSSPSGREKEEESGADKNKNGTSEPVAPSSSDLSDDGGAYDSGWSKLKGFLGLR